MLNASLFTHPHILRRVGSPCWEESKRTQARIWEILLEALERNVDFSAVSPQNLVLTPNDTIQETDFYKRIIALREFAGTQNQVLINPEYEILGSQRQIMHEWCGSIQTLEWFPFMVLNAIPTLIRLRGTTLTWEKIEQILEWTTSEAQELIAFTLHEIHHLDGRVISDSPLFLEEFNNNQALSASLYTLYPELFPAFLDFDEKDALIHLLGRSNESDCTKEIKAKNRQSRILPFYFDQEFDDVLATWHIVKDSIEYKVRFCERCMKDK